MARVELDDLVGDGETLAENHALTSGENVVRGQALAMVTATGKLEAYVHADVGAKPFYGIATTDSDATDGELPSVGVYVKGIFNTNKVEFASSLDDVEDIRDNARTKGVFFSAFVDATPV